MLFIESDHFRAEVLDIIAADERYEEKSVEETLEEDQKDEENDVDKEGDRKSDDSQIKKKRLATG